MNKNDQFSKKEIQHKDMRIDVAPLNESTEQLLEIDSELNDGNTRLGVDKISTASELGLNNVNRLTGARGSIKSWMPRRESDVDESNQDRNEQSQVPRTRPIYGQLETISENYAPFTVNEIQTQNRRA